MNPRKFLNLFGADIDQFLQFSVVSRDFQEMSYTAQHSSKTFGCSVLTVFRQFRNHNSFGNLKFLRIFRF